MDNTKKQHIKSRSKKRRLYEFLERAGVYLLVAFSLSLLINALIAGYYGFDKLSYKVETNEFQGVYAPIDLEKAFDKSYKTQEEHEWTQERTVLIETIGLTAILGWIGVHPGFKKGIKKIICYLKDRLR